MTTRRSGFGKFVWVWAVVAGCECSPPIRNLAPEIEILNDDGSERTRVDFGSVQAGLTYETTLRVRNVGTADLVLEQLDLAAPFGVKTQTPVVFSPGSSESTLAITYSPTRVNVRDTATLKIYSNDSSRPQIEIEVAGMGISAVVLPNPNPIDLGNVYLGESKSVTLTLSNAGSNTLRILNARFSETLPQSPILTADLAKLVGSVEAGKSVSTELSFTPTDMMTLVGTLELEIPSEQGGNVKLNISGRGVQALPRLCFQFDEETTPTCTSLTDANPNLLVRFGALCDSRLYPVDGGSSLACTSTNSRRSGKLWFENAGNFPVSYSVQYTPYPHGANRCDAGFSPEADFAFDNAPLLADGGTPAQYSVGTVALPTSETLSKPWESAKVSVTYTARSRCRDEASDLARVVWVRQGEPFNRTPSMMMLTLDGTSRIPQAVPAEWRCGSIGNPQNTPCVGSFYGVNNTGDAPLNVTDVVLKYEKSNAEFGGTDAGGVMETCSASSALSSVCARFAWDGGTPADLGPHLIPAMTSTSGTNQKVIGSMVFAPRGGGLAGGDPQCTAEGRACVNQLYTLFGDVVTDDPYNPTVRVKIQGVSLAAP